MFTAFIIIYRALKNGIYYTPLIMSDMYIAEIILPLI